MVIILVDNIQLIMLFKMADCKQYEISKKSSFHDTVWALKSTKYISLLQNHSPDIYETLLRQDLLAFIENLKRNLEELKNEQGSNGKLKSKKRDEILLELNILRDVFTTLEFKFVTRSSKMAFFKSNFVNENELFQLLINCLNCGDQFIAFQSHCCLVQLTKCLPDASVCRVIDKLVKFSMSRQRQPACSWSLVYTVELIKEIFLESENSTNVCKKSSPSHEYTTKDYIPNDKNDVPYVLFCHWLKLTDHILVNLLKFLSGVHTTSSKFKQQPCFHSFQQILTTLLSLGKILFASCDPLASNQILGIRQLEADERSSTLAAAEGSKFIECEKESAETDFKSLCDLKKLHSRSVDTANNGLQLTMFIDIISKLLQVNLSECSLHFRRTIYQFLLELASSLMTDCKDMNLEMFEQSNVDAKKWICHTILNKSPLLLTSIPLCHGKSYFGGVGGECMASACHSKPVSDEVSSRKALLLVVKVIMVSNVVDSKGKFNFSSNIR